MCGHDVHTPIPSYAHLHSYTHPHLHLHMHTFTVTHTHIYTFTCTPTQPHTHLHQLACLMNCHRVHQGCGLMYNHFKYAMFAEFPVKPAVQEQSFDKVSPTDHLIIRSALGCKIWLRDFSKSTHRTTRNISSIDRKWHNSRLILRILIDWKSFRVLLKLLKMLTMQVVILKCCSQIQ